MTGEDIFGGVVEVLSEARPKMLEKVKTKGKVSDGIRAARGEIDAAGWPRNYFIVTKREELDRIAGLIWNFGEFVFDTETSSTYAWDCKCFGLGIYVGGQAFCIPIAHQFMPNAKLSDVQEALGEVFKDPRIQRTGQKVKFDGHVVRECLGIEVGPLHCDTLLMAWVVDPTMKHGLKEMAEKYGFVEKDKGKNYTEQFGKTAWSVIDPKVAAYYLCKDVELTFKVQRHLDELLEKKPKLDHLFWKVEMPVLNISFETEARGIKVDMDYVNRTLKPQVYTEYYKAWKALEPFVAPHLGMFEPGDTVVDILESNPKLYKLAFGPLGIPLIPWVTLLPRPGNLAEVNNPSKFSKRTLAVDALTYLKHDYEFIKLLAEYRKVATVKKMFVDTLPDMVINGYIHPDINTIGTETGRMSMNSPNLQQIPSRMGALVRNMFIPEAWEVFISMDASQQEMRLLAHFSRDPALIKAFTTSSLGLYSQAAMDIFTDADWEAINTTRQEFASWPTEKRKDFKLYRMAKSLILGLGYGMGPKKYARTIGADEAEGKRLYNLYHSAYRMVKPYWKRAEGFVREHGHIVTLLGRERPIQNIDSFNKKLQGAAVREAANTPIQGSAGDQLKVCSLAVYKLIREKGWPVRIALWVHDEIIFAADKKWVQQNPEKVNTMKECLETAMPLCVPMVWGVQVEPRWGTAVDLDKLEETEVEVA